MVKSCRTWPFVFYLCHSCSLPSLDGWRGMSKRVAARCQITFRLGVSYLCSTLSLPYQARISLGGHGELAEVFRYKYTFPHNIWGFFTFLWIRNHKKRNWYDLPLCGIKKKNKEKQIKTWKKFFKYFCLFFSIFSFYAPQGHKTYQVIFLRLLNILHPTFYIIHF